VKIGFVGLGLMGSHMATHLARVHDVTGFDIDATKAESIVGAAMSDNILELAKGSKLVLMSLPTSVAVETVVLGLIEGLSPGSAVIDTSTTEPSVTLRVAAALSKRGVDFLDAPVSGGPRGASEAKLSVMVGGAARVFDRYKPILELIGSSVVRVGESGAGEVAKLVNNMIVGSTFCVIAESFALGMEMGLDPELLYDAIKGGWASSAVLDVAAPGMINRDFESGGSVDILFKDIGYALALARSHNVPTPMTALVDEIFKTARASGRGSKAQHVIIELYEQLLGKTISDTS